MWCWESVRGIHVRLLSDNPPHRSRICTLLAVFSASSGIGRHPATRTNCGGHSSSGMSAKIFPATENKMKRAMLLGGLAGLLASCAIPILVVLSSPPSPVQGICYSAIRSEVLLEYLHFYSGLGLISMLVGPIVGVLLGFSRHVVISVLAGAVVGCVASLYGSFLVASTWLFCIPG